ncbi:MAG: hypothetical protein EOO01_27310 [Chitinophagaceae bacterium]|nr:MAG: hypothetical protein EOO01_27310 [Chitinophagaceae bacterium]
MKRVIFFFLVLLMGFGAYLVFTNPSEDEVRKQAEYYVTEAIEKKLPASATADGATSDLIHLKINESMDISDYYFFKKVSYTWEGKTHTIGYGLMNEFKAVN